MIAQSAFVDKQEVANALRDAILRSEPKVGYTRLARKINETYDRLYNMANGRTEPDPVVNDHELLGYLIGWYKVKGKREEIISDPDGLILNSK